MQTLMFLIMAPGFAVMLAGGALMAVSMFKLFRAAPFTPARETAYDRVGYGYGLCLIGYAIVGLSGVTLFF